MPFAHRLSYALVMQRVKLFLYIDGAIVAVGAIFFLIAMARRKQTFFKDDLWAERKVAERTGKLAEFEAKVDQKILLEHRPDPKEKPEPRSPAPEFRLPNFNGKPHEILGIPANPTADLIARAHKHWIKRYHPDRVSHLGSGYAEQARRRAEQLNTARQTLLKAISAKK